MIYYQKNSDIHTKKLNTIEEELNDILAIALTKEDIRVAIIVEKDKDQYYKDYILDFFAAKEISTNSMFTITLTNHSSFIFVSDTNQIILPKDYILNTTNKPIVLKNEKVWSTYLREKFTFTF